MFTGTNLNEHQKQAIDHVWGALKVIAPVGTGKTLVLAHRVINAISKGIPPERILCLTFTNKAAMEMRNRIAVYAPSESKKICVKTFHAFCAHVLRIESKNIGLDSDYVIYDEQDAFELLKEMVNECNLKLPDDKTIRDFYYEFIDRPKCNSDVQNLSLDISPCNLIKSIRNPYAEIAEKYYKTLAERHALDFPDLIFKVRSSFYKCPEIKNKWSSRYDWIQVDEVQDTHLSEYAILKIIGEKTKNMALFGDVDQTIYEWRGSDPFKILNLFDKDFNPVTEIQFQYNYRSTRNLLLAATSFANSIGERWTKKIESISSEEGPPVIIHHESTPKSEADWIASQIQKLPKENNKFSYNKIGVLCRNNELCATISRQFNTHKITHVTVEQYEFFRRQEVKDVLAHLKILINPHDTTSLHRILLRPNKGVGTITLKTIRDEGKLCGLRITDLIFKKTYDNAEPYGDLLSSFQKGSLVILDVETTGLSPGTDEVIEIAAIKITNGAIKDKFHKYIPNTVSLNDSSFVHQYTEKFLRENGEPATKVFNEFNKFVDSSLIVGHNITFDIKMIKGHSSRLNISHSMKNWEDTLDIAKRFLVLERYDLNTIAEKLNFSHKPSHKAIDDVLTTYELLKHLINIIAQSTLERTRIVGEHYKQFYQLAQKFDTFRNHITDKRPPELLELISEESGLNEFYKKESQRLNHLIELYQIFSEKDDTNVDSYSSLTELINFTVLSRNIDHLLEKDNRIPIITIHQSKGLEFDTVFIAGATEDEIPHYFAKREGRLEEEKRLFYVAMTRAKKNLFISSHRKNDRGYIKSQSQFLSKIDSRLYKTV